MNKRQLIEDIRGLNPTAPAQFLEQFDESALNEYLARLRDAREQRPRISGWEAKPRGEKLAS